MKRITLTQGKTALVSDRDYWLVRQLSWHARCFNGDLWYARTTCQGKTILMHRLIAGFPPFDIDHRDRDGLNNQRGNLRPADGIRNGANKRRHKNNKVQRKGVSWHKRQCKWNAQIQVAGKKIHVGSFSTPIKAQQAYAAAARLHFRDYARAA